MLRPIFSDSLWSAVVLYLWENRYFLEGVGGMEKCFVWVHGRDKRVVSRGVWQSVEDTVACWHNSKTALLRPPPKHLPHGATSQTVTKKTGGGGVCVRVRNCVWACVAMMAKEGSIREEEKRRRREGSCKQIMTPSNDYLRLPLWPPVPITEIRQPEPVSVHTPVCLFSFLWSKMHVWFWLAHMHAYSMLAIRDQTLPFPHCLAPVCTEGCASALASMARQPLLIASGTADGLHRKTYLSWENVERMADWFWEVGNKSNILPILSRISKLPSSLFALLSAPSLLASPFSCLAAVAFFLSDSFIPLFLIPSPPHICLPHSLGKGLRGQGIWIYDLNHISQHAVGGRGCGPMG